MSTKAKRGITHETRIISFQRKNSRDIVNSLKVDGGDGSPKSFGGSGSESEGGGSPGLSPSVPKSHELGLFSGAREIDFQIFDDRTLFGEVDGDTTITFKNFPFLLFLTMRLHIKSVDPIITIGGHIVSGTGSDPLVTTAIDEFIDVTVGSDDQGATIFIGSVRKNDSAGEEPAIPQNVATSNHSDTSVTLSWDPPDEGSLPMLYDVLYSTSPAETDGVPDSPINDPSTLDLTDTSVQITGLSAATAYYFWVRAKNDIGTSAYNGPEFTVTDGSYNAGDVGFSLTALDFNTIQAEWTQPAGKQLRFTLKRDFGGGETETVVDNDVPAEEATETYDDDHLQPSTEYDYIFEVRNEFGTLISTINASETTDPLPDPSTVLSVNGVFANFAVTFPADITLAIIEYALDSGFTQGLVTRNFPRPLGDWSVESEEDFPTGELIKQTTYYGRVKFVKNGEAGSFANTTPTNVTTSDVSAPSQPGIVMSSPSTGAVRIKLDFNDGVSTGEKIIVSYRLQASVGPYTEFEEYERDNPPADDLDADEDEIEVIRGGFDPGESYTFRAVASNQGGFSSADTDNVLVDS